MPQGSPISPFLFNIYCADALEGCGQGHGMQADDMCVWRTHKTERVACKQLTRDLETVYDWGERHHMRFSLKKCKVLRITNRQRRKLNKFPIVFFGGQVLEVVSSHKYLGVIIDRALLWRQHIEYIREKAEKRLRTILRLSNTERGVSQKVLLLLYESCLRPVLEYASEVWGDAAKTHLQKLTSVQHHALKACIAVNRRSHTEDTCVETQVPPLEIRRKIQLLRFWKSIHRYPRPLTAFLHDLTPQQRLRQKNRASFLERVSSLQNELNFSSEKMLSLSKTQLETIERNLWRQHRQTLSQKDSRSELYHTVQPSIEFPTLEKYDEMPRMTVAQWHGCRLGTLPLNHFLHTIGRHETGECECGDGAETVEHFLSECRIFAEARRTMIHKLKTSYNMRREPGVARILAADDRSFGPVCEFLRAAGRFEKPEEENNAR